MFPKNWDNLRIEEEIAFAFKNTNFVGNSYGAKEELIEKYIGKSTTGMEIEFIYNNGKLITTTPVVNLN